MWLERFSTQSRDQTPAATLNRSFSPAPRHPGAQLRRPGIQPRSSSLSVASLAASTESLPAAARLPNGTNLREQLADSSADVADPLDVLESIIGPLKQTQDAVHAGRDEIDFAMYAGDIEFTGLSLEEFADGSGPKRCSAGEEAVVEDFEKEKDKFEDLHKSIAACDEVLKSVESYLTSFQAELAAVSSEIETLQDRSTSLNNRLENRKAVETVLGPEVEAFGIPPAVVRKITEGAVDDQWIRSLQELERRSKSINAKIAEGKDVKAAQDIQPFIHDVSAKAVERIRDYVVAQIKALRSPNINAQIIQQNSFLRYKDVFSFLAAHQPTLAEEISQAYSNTMRWYYLSNFSRYKVALDTLSVHAIDQTDVLASEGGGAKRAGKVGSTHDAFSIGRRMDILLASNNTALPSFVAEDDKGSHYLEVPFRALNLALVDNACAEYSFLTEFFPKQHFQTTNKRFNDIFQPTFELGRVLTKQLIEQTFDALGILSCVRLTQHFAFELQRRKVPVAENYINGTNMLLWPRFQQVIDAHCESIRKATSALSGKPAGSALGLTSSSSTQTTAPHPLTQRFANFVQGLLALSSEAGDDEPVSNSLRRLRGDFGAFLIKLSKGIPEARKRERFLFNNYSLVCTIIGETKGKLADEIRDHFMDLRDSLGIDS